MTPEKAENEIETIELMLELYCGGNHGTRSGLCEDCRELLDYTRARVEACPQLDNKPTCKECTVHCFAKSRREKIRQVMRYAGPRMVVYHPVRAVRHWLREG